MAKKTTKRQWSKDFRPRSKGTQINISNVPTTLQKGFAAKCRKEGKSQRNLVLSWIRSYLHGHPPFEEKDAGKDVPDEHQAMTAQA